MVPHQRKRAVHFSSVGRDSCRSIVGGIVLGLLPTLVGCTEVYTGAKNPEGYGLTVSGTGRAVADPDVAIANVGVEVRDADPQRAVEQNNKQMSLLVTNLKAMGIQDADLQTSNFSISYERPQGDYRPEPPRPAANPAGDKGAPATEQTPAPAQPQGWFVVNNTLRVKVRDLTRLGDVLSTATASGANSVWGVDLQLDKPEPLLAQARDGAIQDALSKAKRLAEISGVQLGEIVSIDEHAGGSPGPQGAGMLFAREAKSSVPVEAGSLELSASVTVRFAIDPESTSATGGPSPSKQ